MEIKLKDGKPHAEFSQADWVELQRQAREAIKKCQSNRPARVRPSWLILIKMVINSVFQWLSGQCQNSLKI